MENTSICEICNQPKNSKEVMPIDSLNASLIEVMRKEHPNILNHGVMCLDCLQHYSNYHLIELLEIEKGNLSEREKQIAQSVQNNNVISKNTNKEYEEHLTIGEKASDAVATFGGSWKFIIVFLFILIVWMIINTKMQEPFDQYPFILLNLFLSCIAALQSPIIMMSQNRKEAKDRLRAENDYEINLKTELEIRRLHDKVDYLMKKIK